MPIPKLDDNDNLPVGVHVATMVEIKARFAYNKCRQLFTGFSMLARHLKSSGCKTLYLDGSFVTDRIEPGDYDATWEAEGVNSTIDPLLRSGDRLAIKQKYLADVFCQLPQLSMDFVTTFQKSRDAYQRELLSSI
jgi:hypothetical protein